MVLYLWGVLYFLEEGELEGLGEVHRLGGGGGGGGGAFPAPINP